MSFVKTYYRKSLTVSVVFANRRFHASISYLSIYFQILQNRSFLSITCLEINSIRSSHMNNLSELMNRLVVDQQAQSRSEDFVFIEHEKFQIFFFSFLQSDSSILNLNVNLRRRSEKTRMQKMKQSNKSRRHSREFLNVYLSDTLSKNVNQKNIVNFIRRKQNQFVESYNELFEYFTNKFEKFDDRLNQLDNKFDALFVIINNKFETLKNKMTRNIAIVMKIEFVDFKKNFEKLKIEFVNKSSVSQKTVILNIAKNVSINTFVLHSKSNVFHDSFESFVQNSFIKQDVRSENYKSIFDQTSHMKQRFEMIFSFESNFNQNSNIFSYSQLTFEALNKQFRLFDNDLSNNDHENRRNRSMNRSEYIKNQSQSRDRHDVSIFEVIMTAKQNQFKTSNIDFFHLYYFEDNELNDYVVNDKKIIYTSVQMFVQIVKRYAYDKIEIAEHLYLCFRKFAQIWFTSQNSSKQQVLLNNIEAFCNALTTRYEKHLQNVYNKLRVERYIIKNAQKQRQFDEYIDNMLRYAMFFKMFDLIVLTMIYDSLNDDFIRHVRKSNQNTNSDEFIRDLEEIANYWSNKTRNNDDKKTIYQREVKSNQKQNFERFERYSKSYIENYSTNYFFRFQDAQSSRNWQTLQRNVYTSASLQNRSQYSQHNQISATQNLSSSQRISQYSTRSTQYFSSSSNQKLLINNVNYNAFISSSYESENHMQYDYNVDNEYEEKQAQARTINENIKFETFEHANFDDIIISFHAKASKLEIFNDEKRTRHDMILMFYNICKESYINNDDRARLDNHMSKVHDIDTKSKQSIDQKRYINWMKHAILHVITIRESSSKREYVIIQTRLYDEINENISICIDIEFNVNFIDKFLLSENNLWNRLHNCHSITMRNIANERIVNQQMNIFLYVTATDDTTKRIKIKIYVNKSIKVDVILSMNELDKIEDDIILWLDRKKMQLDNCHVIINFTSRSNQFVIFFANATSRSDYTDLKSYFKSFDDKYLRKSIRFAMSKTMIKISYKWVRFSNNSSQIKLIKIEEFQATYDFNIANLRFFAIAFNFASNFANVFISLLHQRAESANLNWRVRFIISNCLKRLTMNLIMRSRRRNLNDSWRKLSVWWRNKSFS